jgi:hypothetical protein
MMLVHVLRVSCHILATKELPQPHVDSELGLAATCGGGHVSGRLINATVPPRHVKPGLGLQRLFSIAPQLQARSRRGAAARRQARQQQHGKQARQQRTRASPAPLT